MWRCLSHGIGAGVHRFSRLSEEIKADNLTVKAEAEIHLIWVCKKSRNSTVFLEKPGA